MDMTVPKIDSAEVLDSGTSVIGGGIGFNQIFSAVDGLLTDGATLTEWGTLAMALWVLLTSFFAFRRAKAAATTPMVVGSGPANG
jgi:hypothetical protein